MPTAVIGSSDGFFELSVAFGEPRAANTVPIALSLTGHPRTYLDGHHQQLIESQSEYFTWTLNTVAPEPALPGLLDALAHWLDRPLAALRDDTFDYRLRLGEEFDTVEIAFGPASPERVQSSVGNMTCLLIWDSFAAGSRFEWSIDVTVLDAFRESLAATLAGLSR